LNVGKHVGGLAGGLAFPVTHERESSQGRRLAGGAVGRSVAAHRRADEFIEGRV
jgi:hypothetical protein